MKKRFSSIEGGKKLNEGGIDPALEKILDESGDAVFLKKLCEKGGIEKMNLQNQYSYMNIMNIRFKITELYERTGHPRLREIEKKLNDVLRQKSREGGSIHGETGDGTQKRAS